MSLNSALVRRSTHKSDGNQYRTNWAKPVRLSRRQNRPRAVRGSEEWRLRARDQSLCANATGAVQHRIYTLKGNRLFLHIFEWPSNGRLLVGGLSGEILRASYLSDNSHELSYEKTGADVLFHLPKKAPDAANSVIQVEFKDPPTGDDTLLLQTNYTHELRWLS